MTRTVWIFNQYASTPGTGMGGRHYYLARELAKQGHKVYLVAEANHHLLRERVAIEDTFKFEPIDGFTFVWVKLPTYNDAHSNQRVINWFLFSWHIRKLSYLIPDKPDALLCSSPSLVTFLGVQHLAKRFKARLVFEVRDIWPLTLTKIGGYSKSHPVVRLMQWLEDRAYRDSEFVISNLKNAVEHMASRGMDPEKFRWIPNGISLDEAETAVPLDESFRARLPKDKFIVGYTGTFGLANALHTLIETADRLRNRTDIVFVLIGDGKYKPTLVRTIREKSLTNVIVIDAIPKPQIHAMLQYFDVCFIGWLNNPLYKYGIGANKIPEYLYASKPILHAYSGSCDPILEAGAGIRVPAENSEELADAVLWLAGLPENDRLAIGKNGRKAVVEHYSYTTLATKLAEILFV